MLRFDASPLIAFIASEETNYETELDGQFPLSGGIDRHDSCFWRDNKKMLGNSE